MIHTEEDWLLLNDGVKLYMKTWKPDTPPAAIVIFLHGFSDHCNAYYDLFPTLAGSYGIEIHGIDQRGWGRSVTASSSRGLTGPTTMVLNDIHEFVLHVSSKNTSGAPIFLFGHSMGGAQALLYLITEQKFSTPRPHISGLVLESPYIALHPTAEPYRLTVAAGSFAARILPHMQLIQRLPAKHVSRSPQIQQDWINDDLCHDTGTLAGLAGMLQRATDLTSLSLGKAISGLAQQVPCPLWVGHGTDDYVTWYEASNRLFNVLEVKNDDKVFKSYDGAYHKLHVEPDGVGEAFTKDVGEWIVCKAKANSLPAKL